MISSLSDTGGIVTSVEAAGDDGGQGSTASWTNPWIAEYKRRQAMLMEMRPFEVIAMMRDLNLTAYSFGKNGEELQAHVWRYPEIGQRRREHFRCCQRVVALARRRPATTRRTSRSCLRITSGSSSVSMSTAVAASASYWRLRRCSR